MTEDSPNPDKPAKTKATEILGKANQARESVTSVADTANNAFGAIKWVAITICLGLVVFTGFTVYKLVTAPARAVGNAAEVVTDRVKSGASTVKDGTSDIINRLTISPRNQKEERVFWTTHFGGHENKVCELSMSFGGNKLPVFIAADNKDYATSKSLGSKNNRLMRILIRADGDDLTLNTEWEHEAAVWVMKWRGTTIKKPLDDRDAEQRVLEVLGSAARECGG